MWRELSERFRAYPERLRVIRAMLELGLSISERGEIHCGPIEIAPAKMARALGVDRRTIAKTVDLLLSDEKLRRIFTKLKPTAAIGEVAKFLGFGVITIVPTDAKKVGMVAQAASLIAKEGISIRQIIAEDPDLCPEPKITIVTEKPVPSRILPDMLKIPGAKSVSIA